MRELKIWHIGDTHGTHEQLTLPEEHIDIVAFSGDASNYLDAKLNEPEMKNFIEWYAKLPYEYKLYVAGNHDTSIEKGLIKKSTFQENGIVYLENSGVDIEGFTFWGSPYSPTFGGWAYMKARDKIHQVWDLIPTDTDVLITHGPPKGILDVVVRQGVYHELVGCSNLMKQIEERIKPKLSLFGHIHNHKFGDYHNAAITQIAGLRTMFSNGSVCLDGKMDIASNNGNILILK